MKDKVIQITMNEKQLVALTASGSMFIRQLGVTNSEWIELPDVAVFRKIEDNKPKIR